MKFFNESNIKFFLYKIYSSTGLIAIQNAKKEVTFYKNGKMHNLKNAAIFKSKDKFYFFNGVFHGKNLLFTKKTWRRHVKTYIFC